MGKHSATEILELFTEVSPYLSWVMPQDISVTVIKNGLYEAYVPGKEINLGLEVGTKARGVVADTCLRTGKRIVKAVGRAEAIGGTAYFASAMPIKEGNKVIGCVLINQLMRDQESVNQIAADLAAASEEMTAGMEELSAGADSLSFTSQMIEKLGSELAISVKQTDDIVALIRNIANQTNLLGLNAAIEAARVGEEGRGFAVVAEEVRKLALASATSVTNVTNSLRQIQQSIQVLTGKISDVDQTVSSQTTSIREMASASQNLALMATELSAASERMLNSTEEIV